MSGTILVHGAPLQKVSYDAVRMIGAFGTLPMQRLTGVVLLIAHVTNMRNGGDGIREVIQYAASNGNGLAGLFIRA